MVIFKLKEYMKNTTPNTQTLSSIGLVIGCVLFGLGSLIVAYVSVGSYAMAFWRLFLSSMVFWLLARLFAQHFPTHKKAVLFALLSGVALGLDLALWHESIHAIGPGISTLLNSLQILFLALIGFMFFKEKQNIGQISSLMIAIVGVALIGSVEFKSNYHAPWGFVSGITSGLMLAVSMVLLRQAHRFDNVPILAMMSLIGVGGAVAMLPLMLIFDSVKVPVSLGEWGFVLIYALIMQCLAWGLIAFSIPRLALTLTGLLLLTEPVAALVIDYVWLHKKINGVQWFGAFLTMLAIFLGSILHQKTSSNQPN